MRNDELRLKVEQDENLCFNFATKCSLWSILISQISSSLLTKFHQHRGSREDVSDRQTEKLMHLYYYIQI